MNHKNAKEYLPLVQAMVDGKLIQIRNTSLSNKWRTYSASDSIVFSEIPELYRIKPEPKELWLMANDKSVIANATRNHSKESCAKHIAEMQSENEGMFIGYRPTLFREVTE